MEIDWHYVGSRPAPGRLALVQAFVNTHDIMAERDEITDPDGLRTWLVRHDLLARSADDLTADDVAQALALRESLRAVLRAHQGGEAPRDAVATLNRVAARAHLLVAFEADGATRLGPAGSALDGAFAHLLAAVHDAVLIGTWSRLKACRNDECAWAYYDASKNRSSAWCTMAVCGNRMKSRAYRERRSADT